MCFFVDAVAKWAVGKGLPGGQTSKAPPSGRYGYTSPILVLFPPS